MTPESTFLVPWRKQYTQGGDYLSDAAPHDDGDDERRGHPRRGRRTSARSRSPRRWASRSSTTTCVRSASASARLSTSPTSPTASSTPGRSGRAPRSSPSPTGRTSPAARSSWPPLSTRSPTTAATSRRGSSRGSSMATGDVTELPPSATREVVRPEIAEQMQAMMKEVVCRGTAKQAQVPGLSIAGKTGTGFIAQPGGGYVKADGTKDYYASFVGFLPAEDPQVTILISIDDLPLRRRRTASVAPSRPRCSGNWRRRWSTSSASAHRPARQAARSDPDDGRATSIDLGSLADVVAGRLGGRIVGDASSGGVRHDARLPPGRAGDAVRLRARRATTTVTRSPRRRSRRAQPACSSTMSCRSTCRSSSSTTPGGRWARSPSAIYGQPSEALTMVGITGTNGKTTTAHLLAAILARRRPTDRVDRHAVGTAHDARGARAAGPAGALPATTATRPS